MLERLERAREKQEQAKSYRKKGDALRKAGREDAACDAYRAGVTALTGALQLGDSGWAWADLGDCMALLGNLEEARRAYSIFIKKAEIKSPERAAVIRSILKLFEKFDAAYGRLIQSINQVAPHRVKGGGMPALFVKKDWYMVVPVFYGTDRAVAAVREVRTPAKGKVW
jgi:tetratricopeptide (TPR) repeat protein